MQHKLQRSGIIGVGFRNPISQLYKMQCDLMRIAFIFVRIAKKIMRLVCVLMRIA